MNKCSKCGANRMEVESNCANCGAGASAGRVSLVGKWLSGGGCLIAFSPFLYSLVSGIWFGTGLLTIFTFPVGALVSVIGLGLWLSKRRK